MCPCPGCGGLHLFLVDSKHEIFATVQVDPRSVSALTMGIMGGAKMLFTDDKTMLERFSAVHSPAGHHGPGHA